MKKAKIITNIFIALLLVFYLAVCLVGGAKIKQSEQVVDSFVQVEGEVQGKIKVVRAWYYSTLDNGNTLLETEEGELHEFDNLPAEKNAEYRILFDNLGFVGLWQAV